MTCLLSVPEVLQMLTVWCCEGGGGGGGGIAWSRRSHSLLKQLAAAVAARVAADMSASELSTSMTTKR